MIAEILDTAAQGGVMATILGTLYAVIRVVEQKRNGKSPPAKCPQLSASLIKAQAEDRAEEKYWRKGTTKTLQGIEENSGAQLKLTEKMLTEFERYNAGS